MNLDKKFDSMAKWGVFFSWVRYILLGFALLAGYKVAMAIVDKI